MHLLPVVRQLHERFEDVLTVIGIHAGKFSTERRTERIEAACARLGVTHPVLNDRQFRVWRDYAVTAWPTLALIDPEGYLVSAHAGEASAEEMADRIEQVVRESSSRGTLKPRRVAESPQPPAGGVLRFPTRALVAKGRLWISDTGHGRVLECEWHPGEARAVVVREHAGFEEPRGLAFDGSAAYVADRRGQRIWRLDGEERRPVAGTGVLGRHRLEKGPAEAMDLRSPWGLASRDGSVVVSMAGSHQLWELDVGSNVLAPLAGWGAEDISDGDARGALLAQPTGVDSKGAMTFFADCETSAVRVLNAGNVSTYVGTGLFDFGDRSGVGDAALLQHCEDLALFGEVLAVADTYNDRLKLVDPHTRECVPWPGEAGEPGTFVEPGGVTTDGPSLIVADTGHHRLALVDPQGGVREVSVS